MPADTWAERLRAPATIAWNALLDLRLVPHRLALGDLDLGLDPVALLALHDLRRGALGLPGGVLLGIQPVPPLRVRSAEHRQLVLVQLGGVVHELEQAQVVTDDDQRSAPPAHHLGEPGAREAVEVVRGLVEQRDARSAQADAGDRGQHRLAARQLADASVEHLGLQSGLGERGMRPGLDVPVVADRVEVRGVGVTGLDRAQRRQRRGHAQQLGDRPRNVEREPLGQVRDVADRRDLSRSRGELAGDQPQQRGLARAVAADQSGPSGAEGARHVAERDGAVRPRVRDALEQDGGGESVSRHEASRVSGAREAPGAWGGAPDGYSTDTGRPARSGAGGAQQRERSTGQRADAGAEASIIFTGGSSRGEQEPPE